MFGGGVGLGGVGLGGLGLGGLGPGGINSSIILIVLSGFLQLLQNNNAKNTMAMTEQIFFIMML